MELRCRIKTVYGQAGLEFVSGRDRTVALLGQIPSQKESCSGRIRTGPVAEQGNAKQGRPELTVPHPRPAAARFRWWLRSYSRPALIDRIDRVRLVHKELCMF